MERIIAKFGEKSNGIRETDVNAGPAGREPSAEFPGSQSLATFACFERCIGYERTASTCGCAEGGLRPPNFRPKARFACRRFAFFVLQIKILLISNVRSRK